MRIVYNLSSAGGRQRTSCCGLAFPIGVGSAIQVRRRWAALERRNEHFEEIGRLLASDQKVGADGGEGLRAGRGAEAAGGLLLELGHADIPFDLLVSCWIPDDYIGSKIESLDLFPLITL